MTNQTISDHVHRQMESLARLQEQQEQLRKEHQRHVEAQDFGYYMNEDNKRQFVTEIDQMANWLERSMANELREPRPRWWQRVWMALWAK